MGIRSILANPTAYHHIRNMVTGGLPLRRWAEIAGLHDSRQRVADLGCGPSDILRAVSSDHKPEFYLGLDISEKYLGAARQRAATATVDAHFQTIDLQRLAEDPEVGRELQSLLAHHRITSVLLFGVIHHIDDQSAITTLNLVHAVPTVQRMATQDVVRMPGRRVNNMYCGMDRGEFIRTEAAYQKLIASTNWPLHQQIWSHPGVPFVNYLHFVLSKTP